MSDTSGGRRVVRHLKTALVTDSMYHVNNPATALSTPNVVASVTVMLSCDSVVSTPFGRRGSARG